MSESIYKERMTNYYPEVIQRIKEFQAIIGSEYPEFDSLSIAKDKAIEDAYLTTMGKERIEEWEKVLNIHPIEGSTIDDRRETIIARVRGQGKLNTTVINSIVGAFTGGTAKSWIKDSILFVKINLPPYNKDYLFENLKQELAKKIPSHLALEVSATYQLWAAVDHYNETWLDVRKKYATWDDVAIDEQRELNRLNETPLREFVLG